MKKIIFIVSILLVFAAVFVFVALKVDIGKQLSFYTHGKTEQARKEAIDKGLAWIFNHPANFEKDGLLDIVEEIMLLYHVYLTLDDVHEKVTYRKYIEERIQIIADKGRDEVKDPRKATGFLALAEIADKLDIGAIDFENIIEKQIRDSLLSYPPPPATSYAIWNALLLTRLGYEPLYSPQHLLSNGSIARFARNPNLINLDQPNDDARDILNKFYEITHEVLALGAMGANNISLFGSDEMTFLKEIIPRGMAKYIEEKNIDILAELVVCADMLGYTDFDEYGRATDLIIESQLPDGSFGEVERMKRVGRDPLRHGVLSAVWALL